MENFILLASKNRANIDLAMTNFAQMAGGDNPAMTPTTAPPLVCNDYCFNHQCVRISDQSIGDCDQCRCDSRSRAWVNDAKGGAESKSTTQTCTQLSMESRGC